MPPTRARELVRSRFPQAAIDYNHIYRLDGEGCDGPPCTWQLSATQWSSTSPTCSATVSIGLIDTGVDARQLAVGDERFAIRSFIDEGLREAPKSHGTAIASLFFGADGPGAYSGLLPRLSKVYAASVFFMDDKGLPATDAASLSKAIAWLHAQGAQVVNLSLSGPENEVLKSVIETYQAKGVVFVAAAGNAGPGAPPSYPAAYPGVVAVTAVDKWLKVYSRANKGSYITFAAPGVGLRLAGGGSRKGFFSGTSFAAPFATAAIATIHPGEGHIAHHAQLVGNLQTKDLGDPGYDPVYGHGLLLSPVTCAERSRRERAALTGR